MFPLFFNFYNMEDQPNNASPEDAGYQFDDDFSSSESNQTTAGNSNDNGGYAQELFSKTVHAKFRTFYIDVKESRNGKFLKISEKSRGKKSTIMMDAEDVPAVIEAMNEATKKL